MWRRHSRRRCSCAWGQPFPRNMRDYSSPRSKDASLRQLYSFGGNEPLVAALAQAGVPFLVIGGLAVHFYVSEREADDLDLVVGPTVDAGRRLLLALAAVDHP